MREWFNLLASAVGGMALASRLARCLSLTERLCRACLLFPVHRHEIFPFLWVSLSQGRLRYKRCHAFVVVSCSCLPSELIHSASSVLEVLATSVLPSLMLLHVTPARGEVRNRLVLKVQTWYRAVEGAEHILMTACDAEAYERSE